MKLSKKFGKMFKKMSKAIVGLFLLALAALPALSYSVAYASEYGQPRIGAYYSYTAYNQGMYNYVSPPVALTRYGSDYYISNIRTAVYPQYPFTYMATIDRPYMGYPYGIDRTPITHYSSYGGAGGFNYRAYGY
jgi:hypothetical protein